MTRVPMVTGLTLALWQLRLEGADGTQLCCITQMIQLQQ